MEKFKTSEEKLSLYQKNINIFYRSLGAISVLFGQMVRGLSSGTRVFEYMEKRPTMRLAGGLRLDRESLEGRIEFKGVSFSYPTRADQVLKIYFRIFK